jgi:hypothetical protein
LDGDGNYNTKDNIADDDAVMINTNYGARIDIIEGGNTPGRILFRISSPAIDEKNPFEAYIYAEGEKLGMDILRSPRLLTPEDEDNAAYGLMDIGALIKYRSPLGFPNELSVNYPKTQRLAMLKIGKCESAGGGGGGGGGGG